MIAEAETVAAEYSARNTDTPTLVLDLPVAAIVTSGANPRTHFDEAALAELAESIRQHGVLEPLVVRGPLWQADGSAQYELIAGERRLRASRLAGLAQVPARVLDVDEAYAMRLRLVENLQRVDLDPIEEAEGYRQLHQVLGMKQAE